MRFNRSYAPMLAALGLALISLEGAAAFGIAPLVSGAAESRDARALVRASATVGRALLCASESLISRATITVFARALGDAPGVRMVMVRTMPGPCPRVAPRAKFVRVIVAPELAPAAFSRMLRGDALAGPAELPPLPAPPAGRVGVWGNVL